jgi:hypothetical protein
MEVEEVMLFGRDYHALRTWHVWFAWRPVQLQDSRWAWLRLVHTRVPPCGHDFMREYKLVDQEDKWKVFYETKQGAE